MTTTRIMTGLAEFLPGQGVGNLRVERMVSRRPEPRYEVKCDRCSTAQTVTHTQLRNGSARCKFSGCGKPTTKRGRDLLSEQRQQIADREAERAAEEREVSERRMAAETQDYERPERYAPASDDAPVITDRDRRALRQFHEEEEAAEQERQRPIREAAEKAEREQSQHEAAKREREERKRAYDREWVLSDRDPKLVVSDAMLTAKMPTKDAEAFTTKAAEQFAAEPEYAAYRTPENADAILGYLHRNGVFIADVETILAAFRRLRDLGVVKTKLRPQPQPVEQPKRVNLTIALARSQTPEPVMFDGWDENGERCRYTERQVNAMSSEEMKRRLRLTAASGALALPNVGPGPTGYTE